VISQIKASLALLKANVDAIPRAAASGLSPPTPAKLPVSAEASTPKLESLIVVEFPRLFEEFRAKRWLLLWRRSRDGFSAEKFHRRCDGRANTLTLIPDTNENVFAKTAVVRWSFAKCFNLL
jgi:hypothetical protein